MIVLKDNFKTKLNMDTIIALGSFDGIHLGHISLIKECIEQAKINGCRSMIYTFENHPLSIINKELTPKLLMSNKEKIRVLDKYGVEVICLAHFDKEYMKISPEGFVENLIKNYNAKGIVVGFNNRFGYKNLGDNELLRRMSEQLNFKLWIKDAVKDKDEIISSSKIRNIISEEGDIEKGNKLLNRNFMLDGKVIKGKQLGRKLGFPTVNLDYNKDFVIPRGGVYYTAVEYKSELYKGITNIGYNPTVNDEKLGIETHMFNFDKEIYGEYIRVYFIKRIRDEKKFSSLEGLIEQLRNDKIYAEKQNLEIIY